MVCVILSDPKVSLLVKRNLSSSATRHILDDVKVICGSLSSTQT